MEACIGHLPSWNHSQNTHYKIGDNPYFFIANFKIAVYTRNKKGKSAKNVDFLKNFSQRKKQHDVAYL